MTAVTSDLVVPLAPATTTARVRRPWALIGVTAALMLVMTATTATALVRASTRAHQVSDVQAALADVRASLATTNVDLDSARTTIKDLREQISSTKSENAALMACTDSLLKFIDLAAKQDVNGAVRALRESNCGEVLDDNAPLFGSDGSLA